ncbi:MAG: hypothetical protein LBQ47_09025 [Endomicrobium sp.]|jgi:hypothetical protein|nr:hypothetical protein [Endomicrobium sp.]
MKSKLIEKLLTGEIVEIETDAEYKELVKFWKKTFQSAKKRVWGDYHGLSH